MAAEIVRIDHAHPERAFFRCQQTVLSGGVIVYPTDTFYGLGADPRNQAAVRRIFEIKGRPAGQPILLLISDAGEVTSWAAAVTPAAGHLMKRFWPGPLTLVFEAKKGVLAELSAGTGTIGLRVPGSKLTRDLLRFLGIGLTGTSANISGGPSPQTAQEAADAIGGAVDLILDGGMTTGGKPSTVVDGRGSIPRIIREGAISAEDILASA